MNTLGWIIVSAIIFWLIVLVFTLIRLFNRKDIGVTRKAFWGLIILIAPVVGLIVYLVLRSSGRA